MKKLLFLMVLSALLCNFLTAQHLHRVNNNADFDADFTTLQAAVTAALDNDTIYVESSPTKYEGATISKPLTIIGPGFLLSENPKTQANKVEATFFDDIIFASGSEGSTLMGCKFSNNIDLIISVSDITVIRNWLSVVEFDGISNNILLAQNCITNDVFTAWRTIKGVLTSSIITNNIFLSQTIFTGDQCESVIFSNNTIHSTSGYFNFSVYNTTVQSNIFSGQNFSIAENSGNTISYNLLETDGTNANGNQYNIDMATVFADFDGSLELSTDGKWKLKEASPAIGAGSGGVDCGAFGGSTPYVLSGIPNLPHIYEADIPASATSESGLEVTIKVMSGE